MNVSALPTVNAVLNTIATVLLVIGYRYIRKGRRSHHRCFMISAVIVSAAFLTSYLIYHNAVGSVPYPYHDWTRPVYFAILIPHVVLAGLNVPFILTTLILALRSRFITHRRLARFVWPVWVFVSISGVVIYLMLYRL